MLKLLLGKDWTSNRNRVLESLSEDVNQRRENRILIVPELISHDMERRLCTAAGDTTSRYAEVLTFTRLVQRVSESMELVPGECLDNGGRVVAMASAAKQLSSRLKAYAAVETRPEFLSGLVDSIDEFKRCCITSADLRRASLESQGNLAQKLEELSLLMEAYDSLCSRGKRDPRDQMTWLLEQMETGEFARSHVFYVDGFPDFTRQHMAILEHLLQESPEVTISLNCDQPDSRLLAFEKPGRTAGELLRLAGKFGVPVEIVLQPAAGEKMDPLREYMFQGSIPRGILRDSLFTCHAGSVWQECMAAAEKTLALVHSGCRFRDISIVCADMAAYKDVTELVFHRMNIPLYQSGTEDILQKNVVFTVLNALDAALGEMDQKLVLRFLRSPLSPLDQDTCDELENYAITWGIQGSGWNKKWEYHPDGLGGQWNEASYQTLERLNGARVLAIGPLESLRKGFRTAKDLAAQVQALFRFLEEIQLEERLERMALDLDLHGDNREAQILNQLWEILLSGLEQMMDVLGNTHWEGEHFTRLLRLLLSQYDVGTIPPVLDAVQIGPVSAMRCHQQKHLIVLGAAEGNLPGYPGSSGILTDQERVALRQMGVPLTGGAMEGIQTEFSEIYGVFCGAEETVHVFYSGEQPSFVFRRLAALAGNVSETDAFEGFALADPLDAASLLIKNQDVQTAAMLGIQEAYHQIAEKADYSLGKIGTEQIRSLYGQTLNLSASQIDTHAECRMSYFLKYGLRTQERKEAAVDPAEFGTYVHAVLENTARCVREMGGFRKVSLEQTLELAHRFSDEYASERFSQISSERMAYLFRRNVQELDMVVRELWEELSQSLFEPSAFEVNFGGGEELPPIPIPNDRMNAILRGFVDRVDSWPMLGRTYYRVVDYKTGKKDFDYCDVFNGVGLQMLLYMFALENGGTDFLGEKPVPAGVQYFPARAPFIVSDGRLSEEEAQEERRGLWKRSGILLQDETVLKAMEPEDAPIHRSYTIKKDGALSGNLADREQLRMLEAYVFRIMKKMVEDIASGDVTPNPYTRGSSHDACAFCPYGSICHKADVEGRRNYKAMKSTEFWAAIEKEMERYGR